MSAPSPSLSTVRSPVLQTTTASPTLNRKRPAPGSTPPPIPHLSAPLQYTTDQPATTIDMPSQSYQSTASDHQNYASGSGILMNGGGMDGYQAQLQSDQNQLIRMPQSHMGYNNLSYGYQMGPGQNNLLQSIPPPAPTAADEVDHDLQARIEKMKKKRTSIPPFVLKLSSFVNDPATDHLIRWGASGDSFVVLDEDEFSKKLIPDLFKHNNYASFVRQLNMYGFHKVVGLADGSLKTSEARAKPPSEYENPYFRQGQPDLMWLIQKPTTKKKSQNRKPGGAVKRDPDSDNEGESDGEGVAGASNPNVVGGRGPAGKKISITTIMEQLEAVRNHQAMISAAIQRLRKEHQQLYHQSLEYQNLHQKHESSINAILSFLATVYDKSLAGSHLTNGLFNGGFNAHQVDQGGGFHRPVGAVITDENQGVISSPVRQGSTLMRTPQPHRKRQLLLEGVPEPQSSASDPIVDIPDSPSVANNAEPVNRYSGSPAVHAASPDTREHFTPNSNAGPSVSASSTPALQFERLPTSSERPKPNLPFSLPPVPAEPLNPEHGAMTPRAFNSLLENVNQSNATAAQSFLDSSQTLARHNERLAAKSSEIEELEKMQDEQNTQLGNLMDVVNNYATTGSGSDNAFPDDQNSDFNGNDTDFFNLFGNADAGNGTGDYSVEDPTAAALLDEQTLRALFPEGDMGVDGGVEEIPETPTSTVGSTRAREEFEEDMEEVEPKRRRIS